MIKSQDMLRANCTSAAGVSSLARPSRGGRSEAAAWEVRPGGMLVQKRRSDQNSVPVPTIKVMVKYGSSSHDISISPHASFGDLKKMLAGLTGLQPPEQKLMYRERERDSRAFLDVVGVTDGSKIVLVEDEISRERRRLESQKNTQMEEASKAIAEVGSEINKLAKQVAALECEIQCGKTVVETNLLNLIELLMTQLIKLDGIAADGDVKLQRRMQVKRVQKYIEILDKLKIKNGSNQSKPTIQQQQQKQSNGQKQQLEKNYYYGRGQKAAPALVTAEWETFDSAVAAPPPPFIINSAPVHALGRF